MGECGDISQCPEKSAGVRVSAAFAVRHPNHSVVALPVFDSPEIQRPVLSKARVIELLKPFGWQGLIGVELPKQLSMLICDFGIVFRFEQNSLQSKFRGG